MSLILAVALLAVVTALTCALPGTFLVLRHQSMLVEAMSHAVLPGIALGALISGTTRSPVMVVAASLMGLVVVLGAEQLRRSGLVGGDADQGLVFPALFAVGVIMLSTSLSKVHISQNTVLTGDLNLLALTPGRLVVGRYDLGPSTMWSLLTVLALTAAYLTVFYPVLKVSTFDPITARTMGLPVRWVDLGLMLLVSLTVVVAFSTAGAILVVALMVVPPATALLVARSLPGMIALSLAVAVGSALLGFWVALRLDLATSSMMAVVDGVIFLAVLLLTRGGGRRRVHRALSAPVA
ncbi:metal ABC transporter permease [Actinomyces bowdenii]|uniref:metal ABC transporter permease n=1 Tax=Actinomyces bowdenii TaxID=131109 RepID=UPI00214B1589|nr:metal ABC transporter permease [Actinomyces bowdenii]MCR2052152.1 metal ABC transporter permease [Actinomyces bowdenii]